MTQQLINRTVCKTEDTEKIARSPPRANNGGFHYTRGLIEVGVSLVEAVDHYLTRVCANVGQGKRDSDE